MRRRTRILLAAAAVVLVTAGALWWFFRPGGVAVTPSVDRYPVRGVDLSAHNGPVDFTALASDSIRFAFLKATEGTSFLDSRFDDNYREATRAGLAVGAYHFFRFDSPGYMQALNFLHALRNRPLDLPVVIDIEEWTNPDDRSLKVIIDELTDLIFTIESQGYEVMLYTNKKGYDKFVHGKLDRYPLWIASLTSEPDSG